MVSLSWQKFHCRLETVQHVFAEELFDCLAGFVIFGHDNPDEQQQQQLAGAEAPASPLNVATAAVASPAESVRIIYVEKCACDF
jgi:hypothetical protein